MGNGLSSTPSSSSQSSPVHTPSGSALIAARIAASDAACSASKHALSVAARRLGELVQPYGADTLSACFDALHAASERSEEHTSELQSRPHLVCRLFLPK